MTEFNIFEALGVVQQELRHSDFLAFLLDPSRNHGLGDAFLKRFLKCVLKDAADPPLGVADIDAADMRRAIVEREWQDIDILVCDPAKRLVCAVENKIGSGEHSDQLRRYRETVSDEFPGYCQVLIYLTPEGDEPSDEKYISFSYGGVARLMDATLKAHESTLGPDVRTLMVHYIKMLRRNIVSDDEIGEPCQEMIYRKRKRALDLIFEHRPDDIQSDLAEVAKGLIEKAKPHGLRIREHSNKSNIGFDLDWRVSSSLLYFEFTNDSDKLVLSLLVKHSEEVSQPILQAVRQFGFHPKPFQGADGRPSDAWTIIYEKSFLTKKDYKRADLESLKETVQGKWQEFLSRDLPKIREAINGIEWPSPPTTTEA
jgi:hypothetical protein